MGAALKFEKWTVERPGPVLHSAAMSGYGQFCPVAQALEIVGERWTLLVIRELLNGNYRFNELLLGVPLMSRSLLSQRLKTLEAAGIVARGEREDGATEYRLTPAGRELEPVVMGLGVWGQRWVHHDPKEEELDPVLLMWDLRRNLDSAQLPDRRTVVMFWFRDAPVRRSRYWLLVERPKIELCLTNPGFDVELTIETTLRTMVDVWMGSRNVKEAVRAGSIDVKGPARMARSFPNWLLLSPFAKVERPQELRAR